MASAKETMSKIVYIEKENEGALKERRKRVIARLNDISFSSEAEGRFH